MSALRTRLGLWLLRDLRLRIDASCPHGTFVPGHVRVGGKSAWWSCDHCGFRFHPSFVPDPYAAPAPAGRDGEGTA